MIVTCEQCNKKYKIDPTKLKEAKTLFKCESCGGIIEVMKPKPQAPPPPPKQEIEDDVAVEDVIVTPESEKKGKKRNPKKKKAATNAGGISIRFKLFGGFLFFVLIILTCVTYIYQRFVPSFVEAEIHRRTYATSKAFSAALASPLLLNNYIEVNKNAEIIASLPGVAYAAVLNNKGVVVAGIFGDKSRLVSSYQTRIRQEGFPVELSRINNIPKGGQEGAKKVLVGGQMVYDVAVSIPGNVGEAHVGVYTADADQMVKEKLPQLLIILGSIALLGGMGFFITVSLLVSNPIAKLATAAHRISLGEIDLPVEIRSGGEIGELAHSLERLRFSIKSAIDRLRRR